MGFLSKININPLKKRSKEERKETDYSSLGLTQPSFSQEERLPQPIAPMQNEISNQENIKAKLDLMGTQIESIRIQQESMNQRILQTEQMVKQLLDMAKNI